MMQFTWSEGIVIVNMFLMYFNSASNKKNYYLLKIKLNFTNLPFAFIRSRWSKHVPKWFRTSLASRWHMIANLHKLVTFEHCVSGSQVIGALKGNVQVLFVRSTRFTFNSIEELEYSRNIFGIGTYYIALRHRSHMEYFAANIYSNFMIIFHL